MTCAYCGKESKHKYCNRSCANKDWYRNNQDKIHAAKDAANERRRIIRRTNPAYGRTKLETKQDVFERTDKRDWKRAILACRANDGTCRYVGKTNSK